MCVQVCLINKEDKETYKVGSSIFTGRVGLFPSIDVLKQQIPFKKVSAIKNHFIMEISVDDSFIQKRPSNNFLRNNSGAKVLSVVELN